MSALTYVAMAVPASPNRRLALDHPGAVSRLALLDCIPISEHLARANAEFATRWWHWFFFAQTRHSRTGHQRYRAGLSIDRQHEEADRAAGRKLQSPVLVLWSTRDDLEELYGNPLEIWQDWADSVQGHGIESGHHMAEEAPDELAAALIGFFSRP